MFRKSQLAVNENYRFARRRRDACSNCRRRKIVAKINYISQAKFNAMTFIVGKVDALEFNLL